MPEDRLLAGIFRHFPWRKARPVRAFFMPIFRWGCRIERAQSVNITPTKTDNSFSRDFEAMSAQPPNGATRRKNTRHPVRWKAAMVFDKGVGKPIIHTQTEDLSLGGAAILSNEKDLMGTTLTLLLAQPAVNGNDAPKMLKARAAVVSTVQKPGETGFRHGLKFFRSPDDGLDALLHHLKDAEPAPAPAASSTPAPAPAAAAAPAGNSASDRLAKMKQMAAAKLAQPAAEDPQEVINKNITDALKRVLPHMKDMVEQLNILAPAFDRGGYNVLGVPEFSGLVWSAGHVDFRTREVGTNKIVWETVNITFTLTGNKQISIKRDYPASDKLKQTLADYRIEFREYETRNSSGVVASVKFDFPCEVKASIMLQGQFNTGKLQLKMRNVERFGLAEFLIDPSAIDDESLGELIAHMLGETPKIGPLLLRGA
jgi:hypothetical protein